MCVHCESGQLAPSQGVNERVSISKLMHVFLTVCTPPSKLLGKTAVCSRDFKLCAPTKQAAWAHSIYGVGERPCLMILWRKHGGGGGALTESTIPHPFILLRHIVHPHS